MSYSIQSAASTVSSSETTVSASLLSKESPQKKWWYAAKWSAAFCDSVEERFTCVDSAWENEFEYEEETITVIEEAPLEEENDKKVRVGEYHKSKTSPKNESSVKKNEKKILNQFIQGNHRGWGPVRTPSTQSKKKNYAGDILKEQFLSDGSTFEDVTDGETCEDSYGNTLDYTSTYDEETYDGRSYLVGEDDSYPEEDASEYNYVPKVPRPSMKYAGCDNRTLFSSTSSTDRSSRVSEASRNDTALQDTRDTSFSNLERESPSFGSKGSRLQQQNHPKKNRSFGSHSQPSISSGERSQGSTFAKSSFVTPQKMLSTYLSPVKKAPGPARTTPGPTRGAKIKAMQNPRASEGSKKKLALGRQRATARLIKEQSESKPKAFPYMVNHALFHQTLDNKKKRAMAGRHRQMEV